jgi:hypothetical protein
LEITWRGFVDFVSGKKQIPTSSLFVRSDAAACSGGSDFASSIAFLNEMSQTLFRKWFKAASVSCSSEEITFERQKTIGFSPMTNTLLRCWSS